MVLDTLGLGLVLGALGPGLTLAEVVAEVVDTLGLGLEDVSPLGPGLILGVLGHGLEDVGVLGPGLVLGAPGLGLEEAGLLGPGLVVLDALGLSLEDVGVLGPDLVLGVFCLGLDEVVLLGPTSYLTPSVLSLYLVPLFRCVFVLGSCGAGYVLEFFILDRVRKQVLPSSFPL